MLTAERLRELLHYDPDTGVFTRRAHCGRRGARVPVGTTAGSRKANGYVGLSVDGKEHYAHRLAFLYMTGAWPEQHVDHLDGDQANNRWSNLRDVSRQVNLQNMRRAKRTSKTGLIGASWSELEQKFVAHIRIDGKSKHLGYFSSAEGAHQAYLTAKRQHHVGCTI